jgi:hypothetical protein
MDWPKTMMNEIIAVIRSLLTKNKILLLFDWLKFFEGTVKLICNGIYKKIGDIESVLNMGLKAF